MRCLARQLLFLSAILWTVALLFATAQTGWAEITGNCEATLKGVDLRGRSSGSAGDAIDVTEDEVVGVTFTSPAGFAAHEIYLEFASFRQPVSNQTDDGGSQFTDSVNVDDYAFWGAGLYKVVGVATLTDGSQCTGAVLVNIDRNPLTTVAGVAAAGIAAVGVAGVAASAMEGMRESRRARRPAPHLGHTSTLIILRRYGCVTLILPALLLTALLLTGGAMISGGGQPPGPERGERLPRVGWRPRISAVGLLGGLLAGAGIVVLLQQYAVAPLTRSLAIEGLVIGLVVGLVLPSLIRVWSVIHVNGAIARAERRLNEAPVQQGSPPEGSQGTPERSEE